MARAADKRVDYEFPNSEPFTTLLALMPDAAQSQYIEWLLDFLDDYKKGRNDSTESFQLDRRGSGRWSDTIARSYADQECLICIR